MGRFWPEGATGMEGEESPEEALTGRIAEVISELAANIEPWRQVAADEEHPAYLRQRFVVMHGVGQQAVAIAAARAVAQRPDDWRPVLRKLEKIDWRIVNPEWQGIAVHGGRVYNTASSVRDLANAISAQLGLASIADRSAESKTPRKVRP